jgi:hypothetical protein
LAEAQALNGQYKDSLQTFMIIVNKKDTLFKESFLSFSVTEKYKFNLKLAELFERNEKYPEAANFYEIAYIILKDHPDIEKDLAQEIDILNSIVYLCNIIGSLDKALAYNRIL